LHFNETIQKIGKTPEGAKIIWQSNVEDYLLQYKMFIDEIEAIQRHTDNLKNQYDG